MRKFKSLLLLFSCTILFQGFAQLSTPQEVYPGKEKVKKYSKRYFVNDDVYVDELQNFMKQQFEYTVYKNGKKTGAFVTKSFMSFVERVGNGMAILSEVVGKEMVSMQVAFVTGSGKVVDYEEAYSYEKDLPITTTGYSLSSLGDRFAVYTSVCADSKYTLQGAVINAEGEMEAMETIEGKSAVSHYQTPYVKLMQDGSVYVIVEEVERVKNRLYQFLSTTAFQNDETIDLPALASSDQKFMGFEDLIADGQHYIWYLKSSAGNKAELALGTWNAADKSIEEVATTDLSSLAGDLNPKTDKTDLSDLTTDGIYPTADGKYVIALKRTNIFFKASTDMAQETQGQYVDDLILIECTLDGTFSQPVVIKRKVTQSLSRGRSQAILFNNNKMTVFLHDDPENFSKKGYEVPEDYIAALFSLATTSYVQIDMNGQQSERVHLECDGYKKKAYVPVSTVYQKQDGNISFGVYSGLKYNVFEVN